MSCLPRLQGLWLKGMGTMGPRLPLRCGPAFIPCHCPVYTQFMHIRLVCGPPSPHPAGAAGAGLRLTLCPFSPCPGAANQNTISLIAAHPLPGPSFQGASDTSSSSKTLPSPGQRRQFRRRPLGDTVGPQNPGQGVSPLKMPGWGFQRGFAGSISSLSQAQGSSQEVTPSLPSSVLTP